MVNKDLKLESLSNKEFEELGLLLISESGKYKDFRLLPSKEIRSDAIALYKDDQGIDRKLSIEFKHVSSLYEKSIVKLIDEIIFYEDPDDILIVASCDLSRINAAEVSNRSLNNKKKIIIETIDRTQFLEILDKSRLSKRIRQNNLIKGLALKSSTILILIVTVTAFSFQFLPLLKHNTDQANSKISKVENAIGNLRDLEQYLTEMKIDLESTQAAKVKIEEEYKTSKEIKELTDIQIKAIRDTIAPPQSTYSILWGQLLGFIVGVCASIVAAIIYDKWAKWRQRKVNTLEANK